MHPQGRQELADQWESRRYRDVPKLACRDLGGDCDYVAEAETIEDVKAQILSHARTAHRTRVEGMSRDEREAFDIRIDRVLRRRG
jgi:predicted small metal-binding protein